MATEETLTRDGILKEVYEAFQAGIGSTAITEEATEEYQRYYASCFDANEEDVLKKWNVAREKALGKVTSTGEKAAARANDRAAESAEAAAILVKDFEAARVEVTEQSWSDWC